MNWKIVLKYCIIFFIATATATFPFGFIQGLLAHSEHANPIWLVAMMSLSSLIVSIIVFARLAYIQRVEPLYHALMVGFLSWVISYPINVVFMQQPIRTWILGIVVILVTIGVGVTIGNLVYKRKH